MYCILFYILHTHSSHCIYYITFIKVQSYISFIILHSFHCILYITVIPSHSIHCIHFITFILLHSFYCIHNTAFITLHSLQCIHIIAFSFHYKVFPLCIKLYNHATIIQPLCYNCTIFHIHVPKSGPEIVLQFPYNRTAESSYTHYRFMLQSSYILQ